MAEYKAEPIGPASQTSVRKVMAIAAPDHFYHRTAHYTDAYPWWADPFMQEYYVKGKVTLHAWPFNRSFSQGIQEYGEDLGGSIHQDVFLQVVPAWPLSAFLAPSRDFSGGLSPIPPSDALRTGEYSILSESEMCCGVDCYVVERGKIDRIWLAKGKGLCVVKREMRPSADLATKQLVIAEKIEEVTSGLWLPTVFRNEITVSDGSGDVFRASRVTLLRFEVNDEVSDAVFELTIEDGMLQYDDPTIFRQIQPGGEQLLDKISEFLTRYARLPQQKIEGGGVVRYFWLGFASTVICGAAFTISRPRWNKLRTFLCRGRSDTLSDSGQPSEENLKIG